MVKPRTLVLLLLSLLFVIPVTSSAQEPLQISSLEIAIWPEYDRPDALVIYQLRLAEDQTAPATISLPIPASAGEPHAVAAWYPDGSLDDSVSWSISRQGDWALVEVTTVTNGIWLEFYDDIARNGAQRNYTFSWEGEFAVDSLQFDVMHPIGSQDLRLDPAGERSVGSDGIPRTIVDLGARSVGERFELELSYSKPAAFAGELPTARTNPTLTQFEVALWPEFDQVATLVILRGSFSPDVSTPVTLSLPIPASADEPSAVAFLGEDNRLYSTPFERQVEGEWAWITFEAEGAGFQLEFYDSLEIEGTTRTYNFTWPGAFSTNAFAVEVQQPAGATALQVTPGGAVQVGPDGLAYVRSSLGPQQAGSPRLISFTYQKDSAELSVNSISTAPSIDRPSTTQGGTPDLSAQLPFILGGFGLALVALGIFFFLRTQKGETSARKRSRIRRRKPKPKAQREDADLDAAAVFCHVCGSKASASDHFCRSCGTKLRQ